MCSCWLCCVQGSRNYWSAPRHYHCSKYKWRFTWHPFPFSTFTDLDEILVTDLALTVSSNEGVFSTHCSTSISRLDSQNVNLTANYWKSTMPIVTKHVGGEEHGPRTKSSHVSATMFNKNKDWHLLHWTCLGVFAQPSSLFFNTAHISIQCGPITTPAVDLQFTNTFQKIQLPKQKCPIIRNTLYNLAKSNNFPLQDATILYI